MTQEWKMLGWEWYTLAHGNTRFNAIKQRCALWTVYRSEKPGTMGKVIGANLHTLKDAQAMVREQVNDGGIAA